MLGFIGVGKDVKNTIEKVHSPTKDTIIFNPETNRNPLSTDGIADDTIPKFVEVRKECNDADDSCSFNLDCEEMETNSEKVETNSEKVKISNEPRPILSDAVKLPPTSSDILDRFYDIPHKDHPPFVTATKPFVTTSKPFLTTPKQVKTSHTEKQNTNKEGVVCVDPKFSMTTHVTPPKYRPKPKQSLKSISPTQKQHSISNMKLKKSKVSSNMKK
jgi:hypothetical protein